ncbi:glycosyltransferase family 4 protein [Methylovulum psychrotolerans]|uniref:Colanic acid biosynthesis glycosyltransferase WcaL n=1 Tax=Methylovulum psychrotolerans TaxID=1704499 RepID=A0A2S5CMQ2_9GAMM|nr:glycosyltransferase family 4 protein [Methylovulum psychrotolerans]POZ52105.1 colanic acid biosynthesis glycosyltransferase WcaL [Methylovulum psychrotolerans]
MNNNHANWFCAQMGAREHYAVPRSLSAKGALSRLMTDYWSDGLTRSLANALPSKLINSLAQRFHPGIPGELIHSWNLQAISWDAKIKMMTLTGGVTGRYLGYCKVGKQFGDAVIRRMDSGRDLPKGSLFFGYDTCSLEIMRHLKKSGVVCILDQIDPCQVEIELVYDEQQAWPGWQSYDLTVPDEFYQRHQDEWALADSIVVNSHFSREALVRQGVNRNKICVVPLSYEMVGYPEVRKNINFESRQYILKHGFSTNRPLRVLFLGQIMLRKGIQYLMKAAELLKNYPVVFDIVGPLYISDKAMATASRNVRFHGRVTRNEIGGWYRNADAFILPTLSDGFAITQLEAMAYGLPVITTANCGDVVTDGIDGFIVPTRDPEAIVRVICQYLEQPHNLENHREAALCKSKTFSLSRIGDDLLSLERAILGQYVLKGVYYA